MAAAALVAFPKKVPPRRGIVIFSNLVKFNFRKLVRLVAPTCGVEDAVVVGGGDKGLGGLGPGGPGRLCAGAFCAWGVSGGGEDGDEDGDGDELLELFILKLFTVETD